MTNETLRQRVREATEAAIAAGRQGLVTVAEAEVGRILAAHNLALARLLLARPALSRAEIAEATRRLNAVTVSALKGERHTDSRLITSATEGPVQ